MDVRSAKIVYVPQASATPQAEVEALCDAYDFLVRNDSKKATKPAPEPSGRYGTMIQGDSADARIVQR